MTEGRDPYSYPGTSVLINTEDIRDPQALEEFEADRVAINLFSLHETPIVLPFGVPRLKETHARIFEGVYPWAGEFRQNTGLMVKDRGAYRVTYADSAQIERETNKVFAALHQEETLRGLGGAAFAKRAAYFYGELDAIHPFREGNSRTLRQFFADLAQHAGHQLAWEMVSGDDQARDRLYLARDLAVMRGEADALTEIIASAITPTGNRNAMSDDRKVRIVVMNGQRLIQSEEGPGKWAVNEVAKAPPQLRAGIYPIYMSSTADKAATHDGLIIHADQAAVYQQVGRNFVKHARADFDKVPEIGSAKSIRYDSKTGKAVSSALSLEMSRGRSR